MNEFNQSYPNYQSTDTITEETSINTTVIDAENQPVLAEGDEIIDLGEDFDFEDYIGNNTDKTVTILISDWGVEQEFKLLPGEILESSWMNDATIINIE